MSASERDDTARKAQEREAEGLVRRWATRAIQDAAVQLGSSIVQVPIREGLDLTMPELDTPEAALRAAVMLRSEARWQVSRWVDKARAAGVTWDQVGDLVGIEPNDPDGPMEETRAERAFRHIVDGVPLPTRSDLSPYWSRRSFTAWPCASCGQRVRDYGPFESHPSDNEEGHDAACARQVAAVAEYEARFYEDGTTRP